MPRTVLLLEPIGDPTKSLGRDDKPDEQTNAVEWRKVVSIMTKNREGRENNVLRLDWTQTQEFYPQTLCCFDCSKIPRTWYYCPKSLPEMGLWERRISAVYSLLSR